MVSTPAAHATGAPIVDRSRLLGRIGALSAVGALESGGVTRLAWSPSDRRAVDLVRSWAAATGAHAYVDPVGSLVAEMPGAQPGLAPLAMGSHLDTVVAAGRLDGAYGVVAGVEILAAIAENGRRLRHPLRIAAFVNEEGVVAPPFTGSRAASGADVGAELNFPGPDGLTLAQRVAGAGGDPDSIASAAWGPLAGYLEVHIEQGPVMDATGDRIAVVSAITGQRRARVEVSGQANHAGTTPMTMRRDALVAAARGVLAVQALALDGRVEVATVGRLSVVPDVPNVVPSAVSFSVDVRSVSDRDAAGAMVALEQQLGAIAADTSTTIRVFPTTRTPAVVTDPSWTSILERAAGVAGVEVARMPSGAGHDAQHLAALGPIGMLFVPSIGGISHHPDEDTDDDDLVLGAQVALDALLAADEVFDA